MVVGGLLSPLKMCGSFKGKRTHSCSAEVRIITVLGFVFWIWD